MSFLHDLLGKFHAIRKRETALDKVMVEYHQLEVKLALAKAALAWYAKEEHWHHAELASPLENAGWTRARETLEELADPEVGLTSPESAWNPRKMEG